MEQGLQIVGALLVLAAFTAAQLGALNQHSYLYLSLNLVGSVVLAILAYMGQQWGFLLMETVWAMVSFVSIVKRTRGGLPRGAF